MVVWAVLIGTREYLVLVNLQFIFMKEEWLSMAYSMMIVPFDFADYNMIVARQLFDNYVYFELTPKQAREYFKWFRSEIPYRLELLWEYI